ncbi:hypothetical protein GGX14DRAFT_411522 [Mycena pura]|uniref:Uncharacterized protein n=1 Tax=Mycena pura TaxID=153505 RepID=A0AAD6YVL3_9AGAR|nr:hypothetical protein GGX14DRAFT_411522 [Mycena pura]
MTPEERAQRLASWYEKFPKTLTLDNPPARYREINVEYKRLTPLYALGWHISIGKLVEHLRHGSESQKGKEINQRITDRWLRMTRHEGYKPILTALSFIKAPGFLPSPGTDDGSGILYLFFNNAEQERRRIFEENKEAIIDEMISFMGFESEMKEKVAWHQGPVKGLTSW